MDENLKYEVIKTLVDKNGNKNAASVKLGCSRRQINRLIKGYQEIGKAFFIHGNQGRQPAITIPLEIKQLVVDLYRTKYYNSNLTHYRELLQEYEKIKVSVSTIASILRKEYILSPKATRHSKKSLKMELKALQETKLSRKKEALILNSILSLDEAHPRRPRCAYFGELLQMDASAHLWFGATDTHLHIAVDDSTGQIVGAYFDSQETLNGYYHVLFQILTKYGIPYEFLTDKRTVFEYKKKNETRVEKDTFTQFSYACQQLGISIHTSSVAQAKGRVERMFSTLQSRLPIELRLANVSSIEEANEFLQSYLIKFNKQFALPIDSIKSVFEIQPSNDKINLILAVLSSRKIDNGSSLRYQKEYYLPVNNQGAVVHHRKGTLVMVVSAFDGELYGCIDEQVYALEKLANHKLSSKAFDLPVQTERPKKKYIPPISHPWRRASFERYLKKQAHRQ